MAIRARAEPAHTMTLMNPISWRLCDSDETHSSAEARTHVLQRQGLSSSVGQYGRRAGEARAYRAMQERSFSSQGRLRSHAGRPENGHGLGARKARIVTREKLPRRNVIASLKVIKDYTRTCWDTWDISPESYARTGRALPEDNPIAWRALQANAARMATHATALANYAYVRAQELEKRGTPG